LLWGATLRTGGLTGRSELMGGKEPVKVLKVGGCNLSEPTQGG
jgi:hypothetical protein